MWPSWLSGRSGASTGKPDTGAAAERVAADWLRSRCGFRVVAWNWRNPRDQREEIDLVCWDRDVLVFVEVKARTLGARVPGFYAVDYRKKRVLHRVCRAYVGRLGAAVRTWRLDVVEVSIPAGGPGAPGTEILHFENVPLFTKGYRGRR